MLLKWTFCSKGIYFFFFLVSTLICAHEYETPEADAPIVVNCVGDSITLGNEKDKRVLSYPSLLQTRLGDAFKVVNGGGIGSNGLERWADDLTSAAKKGKPNLVVLQWGALLAHGTGEGDEWDAFAFRAAYTGVVEHVQKIQSHPFVFVCAPPPMYFSRIYVDADLANNRLQAAVADVAHRTGAFFVDLFECLGGARLERPDAFFAPGSSSDQQKLMKQKSIKAPYDGIHPNAVGNALIADALAAEIVSQLHLTEDLYRSVRPCTSKQPDATHPPDHSPTTFMPFSTGRIHQHRTVPVNLTVTAAILARTHAARSRLDIADFYARIGDGTGDGSGARVARPVIACVGDSITEGVGSRLGATGETDTMSYPAILQRMPGFHHFQVPKICYACPSCSSPDLLCNPLSRPQVLNFGKHQKRASRLPAERSYWGSPEMQLALSSHPHIVVVQFGTNDVAVEEDWDESAFRRDYEDLLATFKRLPSRPSVYVCVPPPLYETDDGCDGNAKPEDQPRRCWFKPMLNTVLPGIIREIARAAGATAVVDNLAALGGAGLARPDAINGDLLHPTDLGYLAMAHEVGYAVSQHEHFAPIRGPRAAQVDAPKHCAY